MQFNTRTLLIVTTVAATLVWAIFVPPQWAGWLAISILYLLAPSLTLAGIVYYRGTLQAFCIGAAPWMAGVAFFDFLYVRSEMYVFVRGSGFWFTVPDEQLILAKIFLLVPFLMAAGCGLLAALIRSSAEKSGRRES